MKKINKTNSTISPTSPKTIEDRILELEKHVRNPAGTQLCRILTMVKPNDPPERGRKWTLGIGQMGTPHHFFTGDTIENVVTQAEEHLKKYKQFQPYTLTDALMEKSPRNKRK